MSEKQKRIINDQQLNIRQTTRALEELRHSLNRLSVAASTAVQQIETGYAHCAAEKLRKALNEISEASNEPN